MRWNGLRKPQNILPFGRKRKATKEMESSLVRGRIIYNFIPLQAVIDIRRRTLLYFVNLFLFLAIIVTASHQAGLIYETYRKQAFSGAIGQTIQESEESLHDRFESANAEIRQIRRFVDILSPALTHKVMFRGRGADTIVPEIISVSKILAPLPLERVDLHFSPDPPSYALTAQLATVEGEHPGDSNMDIEVFMEIEKELRDLGYNVDPTQLLSTEANRITAVKLLGDVPSEETGGGGEIR